MSVSTWVVFDLDGTLLDSDKALAGAFSMLGVPAEAVTYGHVLGDECERLGISLDAYLDAYDEYAAQPFPGVEAMLTEVPQWAICSNKHARSGGAELARLKWRPATAWFADRFNGPKRLGPLLDSLGAHPGETVFVGDTDHDRTCAREAGCRFVLAGWNPRSVAYPGDLVAEAPADVLKLARL